MVAMFAATAIAYSTNANAQTIRVPATVQGDQMADLYAKLGGFVRTVRVDIGDEVTEGQILAEIDAPEMEKQLAQKQSMLVLAEAESDQALAKVEEAKAHLEALNASVNEARTMQAQKQAMVEFERQECQRIAQLVGQGAIQQSLLDAARFKMLAAESEIQTVKARIASAQANLAGGEAAILRAEADAAASQAGIKVAQSNIDYVNEMIGYCTIRAPWAGKVTQRMVDPGAFVQSAAGNSNASPLLSLVSDETVIVSFSVSQKNIARLQRGTKIRFGDMEALPGKTFEGEVSRFSAQMDPKTRMMRVEVDLPNPDSELKPGFFGYATIVPE